MQTNSQEPFKWHTTLRLSACASALLIMFCFATEATALPFGKAKPADEEEAPEVVPKVKLTKDEQNEYETSLKNGSAYLKQNNLALAQICFLRCATLNGTSSDAHLGLAYCYAGSRNLADAVTEVFDAIKYDPNKTQARFLLGDIMMADARWDEAGGQYLQILKLTPDDHGARGNLATCMLMMGQGDAAIRQYEYILEKDPKSAKAAFNLAAALELCKDKDGKPAPRYDQAALYYKKVVELEPNNANAYCSLAKCLIATKDYPKAQTLLDYSKKLNQNNHFQHLMQGYLYEVQNEKRGAIEEYTRAVALSPQDADAKSSLQRMLSSGGGISRIGSKGGSLSTSGTMPSAGKISGLKKDLH